MGTTKAGLEHIRRLNKNGNGAFTVTIPIQMIRQLDWQPNQRLQMHLDGQQIIISSLESNQMIEQLNDLA